MQGGIGRAVTLAAIAAVFLFAVPASATAAIPSVFGGEVACEVQGDGVRFCGSTSPRSTVKTFDGVPIDVNVAFPPAPESGADGPYPLIGIYHGYGGAKVGLAGMRLWLDRGYATFSMTNRGFRESCGSEGSRAADPAGCASGYVRLMDTRYEVRDAQGFIGRLVDDGLVEPRKIGAIGPSYGGGMSIALAVLRDRVMLEDGSLVSWRSPNGTPVEIAAATPWITWTDLAYSLTPNGSTLDYVVDAPYEGRMGVMKESLVNGLYLSGLGAPGFYAPEGTPGADLTGWRARLRAGEPYGADVEAILDEITAFHSSYYIDDSVPPAPIHLANGFVDDLFPVDEAIRLYNRTRAEYPDTPFALFAADIAGHPRSQVKPDAVSLINGRQADWLDFYVKGIGEEPFQGAEAMTETCPGDAPSGGPFRARNWARLAPGEIRLTDERTRTIGPTSGGQEIGAELSPVGGGGACAKVSGRDEPGTATYRLDPAPAGGFTLLGSATVIAGFTLPGNTSQVAARLLDVGPDGEETLVSRGLWRPATGRRAKRQVFQLHPNGWEFAEGHVAKLELLARDSGGGDLDSYGRASNDQQPVEVSDLQLRLPVRGRPGSEDGLVGAPAPKRIPGGYVLAPDFAGLADRKARLAKGQLKVSGEDLRLRIKCPGAFEACHDVRVAVRSARRSAGRFLVAGGGPDRIRGGRVTGARLELSSKAERYFKRHKGLRTEVVVRSEETVGKATKKRRAR